MRYTLRRYEPAPADSPGNRLVVFYHVPKCGGCTVSNLFTAALGDGHYGRVNYGHQWKTLARSGFTDRPDQTLAISGHASWGIHTLFPAPLDVFYFTMLREPFSLFVSTYNYSRMNYNAAGDAREFLKGHFTHNTCVQYLGNGDLELAKDRLESMFFFGLVEHYDESMTFLSGLLGFGITEYGVRNISTRKVSEERIDQSVRDAFYELNKPDAELYEFAERLYRHRRQTLSQAFGRQAGAVGVVTQNSFNETCDQAVDSFHSGDTEKALDALLEHEDRSPAARRALIEYAQTLGRVEDALAWAREAAEQYPNILPELARIHERDGRIQDALEAIDLAIDSVGLPAVEAPDDASVNRVLNGLYLEKARFCLAGGRSEEAVASYAAAYAACPASWSPVLGGRRIREELPLPEAGARGAKVAVLRFGPIFSLNALLESLSLNGVSQVNNLLHASDSGNVDRKDIGGEDFFLPVGRFEYGTTVVPEAFTLPRYDLVIVVLNMQELENFEQVFRLMRSMDAPRHYLFPMKSAVQDASERVLISADALLADNT